MRTKPRLAKKCAEQQYHSAEKRRRWDSRSYTHGLGVAEFPVLATVGARHEFPDGSSNRDDPEHERGREQSSDGSGNELSDGPPVGD